jgi:hypothetical protein
LENTPRFSASARFTDNAGPCDGWLHIEVADQTPEAFEAAWRSLPKPQKDA